MTSGLALMALASLSCASAHAAAGRAEPALADPAPVPGTLDYQYAALEKAGPEPTSRSALPARAADAVTLPHRVVDAAGAFDGYMRRAAGLGSGYRDAAFVRKAVDAGSGYEATQLQQGAVAYGALIALQDPGFVSAVRDAAPSPAARERLARELLDVPASVLRIDGAGETAVRVSQLVGRRGQALIAAGDAVNVASHSVQKEAWSRAATLHPEEQLRAVKAQSSVRGTATPADADALFADLVAMRRAPGQSYPAGGRPTRAVAQSLALAALAVLGHGGEAQMPDLEPLLSTGQGADCLKLAKLNLYQCLAVVGPQYENMFCLGRHALGDTGQCVVSTAGYTGEIAPEPVLVKASLPISAAPETARVALAPPPAPVIVPAMTVPVADTAVEGPERDRAFAEPPPAAAPAPSEPPPEPPAPAPVQVARADLPSYADLPRRAAPGDDAQAGAELPPAARYAYADRAPAGRRGYGRWADPRDDDDAPPAQGARYSWDPADGPPPAYPPGWHRGGYGPGYGRGYGQHYGEGDGRGEGGGDADPYSDR